MVTPSLSAQLGARLRFVRHAAGLTQRQLADRIGVSPPEISKYERGRRAPSFETLVALADGLRVPLPELLRFGRGDRGATERQRILQQIEGLPTEGLLRVARVLEALLQPLGGTQDEPERRATPK